MCGIAGIVGPGGVMADEVAPLIEAERHRGPDGAGCWADGTCALGHRRLAVIDLSDAGRQPLASEDGGLQITFNGEVYNYRTLREELSASGWRFRTHTDTEVVLAAYARWGADSVNHLRGMFAYGIWDQRKRSLLLVRDRVGKKPLFYTRVGERLIFASELQALLAHPGVVREVSTPAIDLYLSWGYIPAPLTAFAGVSKLPPAHVLTVAVTAEGLSCETRRYWSLAFEPKTALSLRDATRQLRAKLDESVRIRLQSDVPLGAFLSGGVDSSIVVGLMAQISPRPVRTFSIGFAEEDYSELEYARVVARRWKTDHQEFTVRPSALTVVPRLVRHYGEPYADASAIPTFYLSEMTRTQVTVALSGDGGDESFAGYDRYRAVRWAERIRSIPGAAWSATLASRLLPGSLPPHSQLRRARRFLSAVREPPLDRYLRWTQFFSAADKERIYSGDMQAACARTRSAQFSDLFNGAAGLDAVDAAMAVDIAWYLPYDLLVKMDIASMANSLEVRSPFLDHEVMELAASFPAGWKLHGMETKYILKRACADVLPPEIARRGKMGFGVPIAEWLRNPLRDMMHDVLLTGQGVHRGLFDREAVTELVGTHVRGERDHGHQLWNLLMLELWHREFIDRRPAQATGPRT